MTPQSPFRDAAARRDAIRVYRLAADALGDLEQVQAGTSQAEDLHTLSLISVRALCAEMDDPEPQDPPECHCLLHEGYAAVPSYMKLVPLEEAML